MPSTPGDVSIGVGDFSWLKGSLSSFSSFPDAEVVIHHHSCRCRATHVCMVHPCLTQNIQQKIWTNETKKVVFSMVLINPPAPSHHIRPKPGHASGWQAYDMSVWLYANPLLLCSSWTTQIMSQHACIDPIHCHL